MITTKLFFPIWMMFLVPVSWAAIIPGIFIIAFCGLVASLYLVQPSDLARSVRFGGAWSDAKKGMWRAFFNLCTAYSLGTVLMLAPALMTVGMQGTSFLRAAALAVTENIYQNWLSVLWAAFSVAAAGAVSYLLNRAWTFRNTETENPHRAALWLAFLTAPYLFLSTYKLFY